MARADMNRPKLQKSQANSVLTEFRSRFLPSRFLNLMIADVNKTYGYSRFLDADKLFEWTSQYTSPTEQKKFDAYSIFFDEAAQYPTLQSEEDQGVVPFINMQVAANIAAACGLVVELEYRAPPAKVLVKKIHATRSRQKLA